MFCEVKKSSRKISTKVHERKIVPEMRLWDTWARKRFCVLLQQRCLREQLRDHLSLYGVRGESPLTYCYLNLDNFLSASVRTTLWWHFHSSLWAVRGWELWESSVAPCLKPTLNQSYSLFPHRTCEKAHRPSQQHHSHREQGCRGLDLRHKCSLHPVAVQWHESAAHRANEAVPGPQKPHHRPRQEGRCWELPVWSLQHRQFCWKCAPCADCEIWVTPLSPNM